MAGTEREELGSDTFYSGKAKRFPMGEYRRGARKKNAGNPPEGGKKNEYGKSGGEFPGEL